MEMLVQSNGMKFVWIEKMLSKFACSEDDGTNMLHIILVMLCERLDWSG